MPNMERHMNPFTAPYRPSIFQLQMSDPKMGIPQNEELFNHVIKLANTEASKENQHLPNKIGLESNEATLN